MIPLVGILIGCTSVSADRMTLVGTDAEHVLYSSNRATGEVSFASRGLNNSIAFTQLNKTLRFGIGAIATASIANSVADAITATKAAETAATVTNSQTAAGVSIAEIEANKALGLAELETEVLLAAPVAP